MNVIDSFARYLPLSEVTDKSSGNLSRQVGIDYRADISGQWGSEGFWSCVDQSGGEAACWPWMGGHDPAGYGQGTFGWTRKTHREAYRLTHPDFDPRLDVLHTCDNPPCCNPAHLFAGTAATNLQDAARKGRLGKHPLDWSKAEAIRAAYANGVGQGALAAQYGVSQALISYIVNGRRWAPRPLRIARRTVAA